MCHIFFCLHEIEISEDSKHIKYKKNLGMDFNLVEN